MMTTATSNRKNSLEARLTTTLGFAVDVVVRGAKEFTLAAEGDKRAALLRYMSGTLGVTITECSYDEECDYTCLFFTAG